MATRKPKGPRDDDRHGRKDGEHKGPKDGEHKGPEEGGYQEREPHEEESGAVEVHRAYLEHRLAGGEPATPELYRRAVEQFQKLPGATRSVPPATPPEKPGTERAGDDEKGERR
jgi:hypothetical protein